MVSKIYAGVVSGDLERARAWYTQAFDRPPDAKPMDGLYEWHAGDFILQVVDLAKVREIQQLPEWGAPGSASITLVVDDLDAVSARFERVSHFDGPSFSTTTVRDSDGNLVNFLQPHDGAAKN